MRAKSLSKLFKILKRNKTKILGYCIIYVISLIKLIKNILDATEIFLTLVSKEPGRTLVSVFASKSECLSAAAFTPIFALSYS